MPGKRRLYNDEEGGKGDANHTTSHDGHGMGTRGGHGCAGNNISTADPGSIDGMDHDATTNDSTLAIQDNLGIRAVDLTILGILGPIVGGRRELAKLTGKISDLTGLGWVQGVAEVRGLVHIHPIRIPVPAGRRAVTRVTNGVSVDVEGESLGDGKWLNRSISTRGHPRKLEALGGLSNHLDKLGGLVVGKGDSGFNPVHGNPGRGSLVTLLLHAIGRSGRGIPGSGSRSVHRLSCGRNTWGPSGREGLGGTDSPSGRSCANDRILSRKGTGGKEGESKERTGEGKLHSEQQSGASRVVIGVDRVGWDGGRERGGRSKEMSTQEGIEKSSSGAEREEGKGKEKVSTGR